MKGETVTGPEVQGTIVKRQTGRETTREVPPSRTES